MTGRSCPKCGSLRTEERPLFTGTYLHCLAGCDGPKKSDTWALDRQTWTLPAGANQTLVTAWYGVMPVGQARIGARKKGSNGAGFIATKTAAEAVAKWGKSISEGRLRLVEYALPAGYNPSPWDRDEGTYFIDRDVDVTAILA